MPASKSRYPQVRNGRWKQTYSPTMEQAPNPCLPSKHDRILGRSHNLNYRYQEIFSKFPESAMPWTECSLGARDRRAAPETLFLKNYDIARTKDQLPPSFGDAQTRCWYDYSIRWYAVVHQRQHCSLAHCGVGEGSSIERITERGREKLYRQWIIANIRCSVSSTKFRLLSVINKRDSITVITYMLQLEI